MTPQSQKKAATVVQALRALPASERPAALESACAADEALRAQVLALLAADEPASREEHLDPAIRRDGDQTTATFVSMGQGGAEPEAAEPVKIALVRGSGPHQASAVESLYRSRMRAGVWIILVGFGGFLAKNVLWDEQYAEPGRRPVLWAHVAIVLAAALVAPMPWSRRPLSLRGWRSVELGLMLLGTVFFALFQVYEFRQEEWKSVAAPGHEAEVIDLTGTGCALRWFAFMVFYGFFVPNTWGRCALVLGIVAVCPVVVTLAVGVWENTLGLFEDVLQEMALWVGLGWAMAVYGSHKIAQLRGEAFEARKLGQYHLKRRLGSGGMGEVWLAEHHLLKQPCAIKLIRTDLVGDPTTLSRFHREVRATAMLAHPNTVRIYDYGVAEDGTFYYTMQYLPGLTFHELVQNNGPLPAERAIYLLRQACSALGEAHAKGLIHRDLKPGNLMTCQLGGIPDVVKLLDFGLVRSTAPPRDSANLSVPGHIVGTPAYLSPEQVASCETLDARTDIYSLGAVAYFLLAGHPPFEGRTHHHVLVAHLEQAVPPLRVPGREVPPDLEAVVLRCMEKDRANRFPDVGSLEEALTDCQCADKWTQAEAARWWREHPVSDLSLEPSVLSQTSV